MKKRFLDRAAAFVVAFVMMVGGVSALPELALYVRADNSTIPCGEYASMTLTSGHMKINGFGDMFDYGQYSGEHMDDYYVYSDFITQHKNDIYSLEVSGNISHIGDYSFNYSSLSELILPKSVTTIGNNAFSCCDSLSKVTLEGVEEIGNQAFMSCSSLSLVELPVTLRIIGSESFCNCKLSEVIIPDKTTDIYYNAFSDNALLKKVIMPQSISYIEDDVFNNCPNLTIYGYKNTISETYAKENNIPFVALDESDSEVSEDDLLKLIEQKSKTTVLEYIYIDMDKDGNKEILAAVENNLFSYEIWYCSSDGLKCNAVTSIGRSSDYANFLSIDYGTEEHVIFNCGNNFGNSQDYAVFALYDGTVELPLKSAGVASITDKDTISVYMHGYDEDGVAVDEESEYKYDFAKRQYNKVSTGDSDTYIVTWVNEDGIPIYAYETEKGVNPEFDFDTWGIPSNGNGDRFTGWSTNLDDIIAVFYDKSEYKGQNGDITYYAIFDDKVNVKWYNGKTLLKTDVCKKNTIPEFTGETPKCHDDEIGLVREFRGWTTSDNSNYDISISIVLDPVTQDTVYYAVFDEDDAEYDPSDNIDVYDVDYINQHIESAKRGEWKFVHTSADLKNAVENPSLEITHGVWKTITIVDKTVNLDYMGIYDEVSANDYNLIMLDMFNSVEGYEAASSIYKESENSAIKDWLKITEGCLKDYILKYSGVGDAIKDNNTINKAVRKLDKAYAEFEKDGDYHKLNAAVKKACSETGINFDKKIPIPDGLLNTYNITTEVLSGLETAISTFDDVIQNAETIISYRTYIGMGEEYLNLLRQMYDEANKLGGNSWEVADLKHAIAYAINYHFDYDKQAFYDIVKNGAKQLYNVGLEETVKRFVKDNSIKFIQKTFTMDCTGSSKYLKEKIGSYVTAIQSGFKYGVKISDKLFDMNSRDECYVKIKEYGVLSEVLSNVLEDRANKLLSASTLKSQSSAAKYYDKAYKMYMFTEEAALTNAAEYEKTHEIKGVIRSLLDLNEKIDDTIMTEWFENMSTKHVETAAKFSAFAEYINKNLKCHKDYVIGESKYADILITYNNIKPHKVAIISCPVRVSVYDENHILVGTLSSEYTSVKQGYEIYMYRVDETDSNVVCVPNDYTIEITGSENGTMNVVASYFDSNEQVKTESYHNVPITSDYKATLEINEKKIDLITDTTNPTPTPDPTPIPDPTPTPNPTPNQISTIGTTPSSPSFSKKPVITSGKSHTRQKLTLKAETSPDSIRLSWNRISGAKKYTVYIHRNGRYEKLKNTAGTSFVFKNPVHGKTYRFLVRYFANGRPSAEMFSGKVTVTVYLKPAVTAHSGKNSIKLSWKPVSGAEKYAVYRYKNGRGSKIYETENTYAVIKNLKSGAKYSYVVRAYVDGKWTQMTKSDIVTAETKME